MNSIRTFRALRKNAGIKTRRILLFRLDLSQFKPCCKASTTTLAQWQTEKQHFLFPFYWNSASLSAVSQPRLLTENLISKKWATSAKLFAFVPKAESLVIPSQQMSHRSMLIYTDVQHKYGRRTEKLQKSLLTLKSSEQGYGPSLCLVVPAGR